MCQLRILRETDEEILEKDLQKAFERDLSVLGKELELEKVDSEVSIGTGRIDTLALDEAGRPTFIEYKRPGAFDHNALIQLMDYVSWFLRDTAHFAVLRELITAKLGDKKITDDIRLILVVSDVSERVRNACYAISCPVVIFSYSLSRLDGGDLAVLPKEILNTSEANSISNEPPPSIQEMVPEQFTNLWTNLETYLRSMPRVEVYNTRNDVRASSSKVFAIMIFQKRYLVLRLLVERGSILDARFKFNGREGSNFGNIRISPGDEIDDQIKNWIAQSRKYVDGGGTYFSSTA
jgi:hypothetical protein